VHYAKQVSGVVSLIRRCGEDLLVQGPCALTNKLLIELSRAALIRALHERSVDKLRTLIQAKSKSSQVAQKIFLSSSHADPRVHPCSRGDDRGGGVRS
jgi:hypothetical protein